MLQALLVRKIAQIILLDRFERGLKFEKEDEQKYSQRTLSSIWGGEMTNPFNYKNPNGSKIVLDIFC